MTPTIYAKDMEGRPLLDPVPGSISITKLMSSKFTKDHRQHRISDYIVGMLHLAILIGKITKTMADVFETPFKRGAEPRVARAHEGHPFKAPDGTWIKIKNDYYKGSEDDDKEKEGKWTIDNISQMDGFEAWVNKVMGEEVEIKLVKKKQTEGATEAAGGSSTRPSTRLPNSDSNGTSNSTTGDSVTALCIGLGIGLGIGLAWHGYACAKDTSEILVLHS